MSAVARNQVFSAVHTVGGLLPADMLVRISEGKDVSGSLPSDYRVVGSRSVSDEAERHWDYLRSVWSDLREKLPPAPEAETPQDTTGLAGTQWLAPLFAELGFGELTAVGAAGIPADDSEVTGKTFPVSHRWNHVPVHLAAWHHALDRRPGGAGTVPPQSLVQECLNRTEKQLWGVVTNGRQLRLLRDSSALATASYVEFDLEAIFDGELFSEFVLLYRLLHVSRFAVADGASPATCWLERWRLDAITSGTRALDQLRESVRAAITTLGTGFLKHPDNARLRENVDVSTLHAALLRLVYRLLFVFVAEDRGVLHPDGADELAKQRYARYFSTAKLRAHARRRRGTAHDDLYRALRIVLDALGDEQGRPELALPGLGGIFDDTEADAPLRGLSLSNEHLLGAVRHLAQIRDVGSGRVRAVDYQHLDAEELGSIYESLLELVPRHNPFDRTFSLEELAGNERKTTGSYYTPSSLIECLLDSTLDPVIDDAVKQGEQAASAASESDAAEAITRELLSLTVCDPACGSGHFLVAAARRIAKRVAAARERNPEPTVDAVRHALHEVIARCIYGVDLNPMAVELTKVSLWLEALEPGKPLSFLDAHIKCGNALVGATPALLRKGIPDEAFIATEGDDKKVTKRLEKTNAEERQGQLGLFDVEETAVNVVNTTFAENARRITSAPANKLREVRRQAAAYASLMESTEYLNALHLADAWCAAFVWIKSNESPQAVTHDIFRALENPTTAAVSDATHGEIIRLREEYQFFHWHLEFPDVFSVPDDGRGVSSTTGWVGGFDCVLGNPPWDSVSLNEQEFFAQRSPKIAAVGKSDVRKKLIAKLRDDPETQSLFGEYAVAKRKVYAESHFLRRSGRFPLTGQGNLNTYAVFCETAKIIAGPRGRSGVIVPTGIATDARTQYFFKDLVERGSLAALYDFENAAPLFPGVHRSFKFCLLSLAGRAAREPAARFAFFVHDPVELDEADKTFSLTPEEIKLLNPNTGTCPVFRSRRDAEITLGIYRRVPVLIKEPDERGQGGSNLWGVSFLRMFDMSHDARFFHTREELDVDGWTLTGNIFTKGDQRMLPLYEAKMLHHYDHRWGTYDEHGAVHDLSLDEKQDPNVVVLPRYWVSEDDVPTDRFDKNGNRIYEAGVSTRLANKHWEHDWLLGWRDICRATDERTGIPAVFPKTAVGHKFLLELPNVSAPLNAVLLGIQCSFAFDFVSRQKIGGTSMGFFVWRQLPVLTPAMVENHTAFIVPRIVEISCTAYDMEPFARDLGDTGPPFVWDEERRAVIRAELDALFFHLYGVSREDADYILDTFPIVKRKDEAKYGTYRTKDLILAEYDRMAEAGLSLTNPLVDGENYTSTLTPPPGQGPRHAPAPSAGNV
ncbi:Eco57I restriction-modification methylase domain-containing protein [Prauserella muralis]|uniref:site-specific DNA-methyltransferase (adenine-specific) n=1 Tax=Prauserella muralis TaxID=588067 RepID=A0A2V4B1H3_9PSEU|nr:DNA methyltransferase [Prauserella muralis]PXY27887.1 restriction endonuclease [Prauserella muralis]TWE22339.1 type II restriction/modification system DNA methylase subunit YeeA [Prauserella muralis]